MSRVVVTGVNGFVGKHLADELLRHGHEVVGIGHEPGHAVAGLTDYIDQDLTTRWPAVTADAVVHLAGLSAVGPSFHEPQRYVTVNSSMVTHLGEALLASGFRGRVLVVSSGAVYDARSGRPLDEESPLGFGSPYVVSKVLVENLAAYYAGRGLDVAVTRPFNHIGPGQQRGFLVPDLLAAGLEAAAAGSPVRVGDLETRRDYTDVRDVVRAYRLLLEAERLDHRVFNVCSGRSWSGKELLDLLRTAAGLKRLVVEVDAARLRPDDPRDVVGVATLLRDTVGWQPEIGLEQSIHDFVATSCDAGAERPSG